MENQETNQEIKTPECIQDLLKINNVTRITKFDEINQIYDYKKLLETDEVFIKCKKSNIIIFDTDVFNSCYVIDVLNQFLEKEKFENTDISYCDNMGIYEELFKDFFKDKFSLEKPIPVILVINIVENSGEINKEDSDIYLITERFGPITTNEFMEIKSIINR